ncbi:MAG: ABC transporter substrate-binding protein [Synergistaceae bacterium]|jgi:peptide/nickel transport system substrate-binding protein|nr:ABC transporter substrate-binding protein [Synergistaceae bacterium]
MKKRSIAVAFLLIVCCVMFSAATVLAASNEGRVLNFAYQAITNSFVHGKLIGMAEAHSLAQVYDTLILKDFNGDFHPNLAERWEISPDGMEYTFYLRKDVKWSDGVDFTAKDVEFTFDYLAKAPAFSWIFDVNIDHMEIVDDHTIKIFMRKPNTLFISTLASTSNSLIAPKHGFEKYGDEYGSAPDKIIGTGAYVVTEWKPDVSITYKAKKDYFRGEPAIKEIKLHRITDTNAAIVAIQTGELDLLLTPINGSAYKTLSGNANVMIGEYISARNEAIYMYCKDGLFSDVRMRKAVAYAINKEDILTVAMDGLGHIINYPGDIGSAMTANPDYVPSITYPQDIEKAKALVKEAGKVGAPVAIKSYNTDPYAVIGTYLQGVLNEIGLDATVEPMERATFLSQLDAEMCSIFPLGWVGSAYDIEEVLGCALHSANIGTAGNDSFYINPEMDAMIEAARGESDPEKRKELYKKVIEKFMEEVPFVSTFAFKSAIPRRADLTTDNPKSYQMFDYRWTN